MSTLGKIVYLSEAQASELFANGSITVDGSTITYSADDLYLTPENIEYVKKSGDTMTGPIAAPYSVMYGDGTYGTVYFKNGSSASTNIGYVGMNLSTRRLLFGCYAPGNNNEIYYRLPAPTENESGGGYDIVTTKGDYTMTGTLTAAAPITSYHSTTPSFAYKTAASGSLIAESAARAGTRQIFFREYASDTAYHEDYLLPEHTTNATGNAVYNILTTKSPVTVAQGGTNATTVEGARTTLNVYSKSEVDALITGSATPSGTYLPISGGTLSGNLNLSPTTAVLRVGSINDGTGVKIFRDSEGGNIALWSPNGTGWQMDAFNNIAFRLYYNAGAPAWSFVNTGGFQIEGAQAPTITLKSNVVDIKSTTNNLSSTIYPAIIWLDKNGTATCGLTNVLSADGSNAFYIYIQNRDGSNNPSGLRGIKYTLSNTNVGSWVISDPTAFRSALSIGSVTDSNVWLVNTSRTANTVLAAPNGSAGSASFRALVAADIPSLSASKITSGIMTGPLTISENLGAGCYVKSTSVDLSSATNGVTSTTQPGFVIQDKSTRNVAYFKGYVESNGNTGYRIGASQFDTSGNQVSQAVIGVSIAKNGTQTWTFPIPFIQAVRSEFTASSTWTNAYSKAKALIKVVFKITYSNNVHVLVIDVPKQVVTTTGQFFFSTSCLHDGKQLFAQGMYTTDGAQWEAVYLGSDVQTYSSRNYYYI